MPDLGITEALALAGLLTSAGGAAFSAYEGNQASGAQSQAAQAAQQAAAQQAANQKQQAITANLANAQSQTGGSLGDAGLTNFASLLAGYGGQAGGPNPSGSPTPSSGTGLQDALSQLTSGASPSSDFSGGEAQPSNGGYSRQQLTQPFL